MKTYVFLKMEKKHGNIQKGYLNNEAIDPKEEVNIIILDIEIPQMDGHHLTGRVKKDDARL